MSRSPSVAECIKAGPGRYSFGQSLYLVVRGGSALWEHQFRENKKLKTVMLGSAVSKFGGDPVTLMQARVKRAEHWLGRRDGRQIAPATNSPAMTFGEAMNRYFSDKAADWKPDQLKAIKAMMARHAVKIMDTAVNQVTRDDLAVMLKPIWTGPDSRTGNRVRGVVERVLAANDIYPNPAEWDRSMRHVLPETVKKSVPRASLPYAELPAFMRELATDDRVQADALRFVILTGVRLDEALEATWREFDFVNRVWNIRAARMKMDRDHRVPLTDAMVAVLGHPGPDDALVFPSKSGGRLAQGTVRDLVYDMREGITVHGFRSTFATWASDSRKYRDEAIEIALSHLDDNKVRAVYRRTDMLDERRELMQDWSNFAAR